MTAELDPRSASRPWEGQRWALLAGYALILGLAFLVLSPFLPAITWAAIFAYASWPAFERVKRLFGGRTGLAAAAMTVGMVVVVMVPAAVISLALAAEVQTAYAWLRQHLPAAPAAGMAWVRSMPRLGPILADRIGEILADPSDLQGWVLGRLGGWAGTAGSLAVGIARGLFDGILILLTLIVFYLSGEGLIARIWRAAARLGGPRMVAMLGPLGETVRAVTYGTLLTALAQGTLLMLGVWVLGVGAPVLLGAITGILALTPVGAALVYVPVSLWLVFDGRYVAAGLLAAWGFLVVSSVDNVIRSWFLRGAASIPFFLGLLGLLGGVAAFGTLGLFLGPVAVALMLTVWREWTDPGPEQS